jgi:hypothetical protein
MTDNGTSNCNAALNALTGEWYCGQHAHLVPANLRHDAESVGRPATCTECGANLPVADEAVRLMGSSK